MRVFSLAFSLCLFLLSCQKKDAVLFVAQPATKTGVDFENTLVESDSFNIVVHEYLYNGGGVGVADFDHNGLPDLVFSGNSVSSELYLQTEPWTFKKVTEIAGLATQVWCAGVSINDIDNNGYEDIYFSTLNLEGTHDTPNLLFLNQGPGEDGIPRFQEVAKVMGLDDSSYCTQAAWLDYDLDGDLDVYLLNNGIEGFNRNEPRPTNTLGKGQSQDYLYQNLGKAANGLPHFQKMPIDFGIRQAGWGLGIAIHDFNTDGYPDIYVANDFISNDILWMNQAGQGFTNEIATALPHQSYNSMGVDLADLTNDGHPEIMVVDMLPDDNGRIKSMFADINYDRDQLNRLRGFQQQYVRNMLQLNHGDGTFSDVSYLTGVAGTDWSWAPLLFDVDNDGLRDIFISNGYPKDITDQDFANYNQYATMFGNREARHQKLTEILRDLPGVHQPNFFFKNAGNLDFIDVSSSWNSKDPTYSNGAVFVDLDLDGDLDLVTNNINSPASLLRNNQREQAPQQAHYLRVNLQGPANNPSGLGARIRLSGCGSTQFHEHYRVRGYLSTVEPTIHFGLGDHQACPTPNYQLQLTWPDGKTQTITGLGSDTLLNLNYQEASNPPSIRPDRESTSPEWQVAQQLPYEETDFNDFNFQYLLQRKYSEEGPHFAVGDLNGDQLEDLIVGGPAGQAVRIMLQAADGTLVLQPLPEAMAVSTPAETSALLLFDADNDGDLDLYLGNGSSEFPRKPALLKDYLFLNDHTGNFTLAPVALPPISSFTGTLSCADLEGDGDLDLFVGGRMVPGQFPQSPPSYLLLNEGGKFTDATEQLAPGLAKAGMISSSSWQDFNGDNKPDLLLAGDFNTVQLWINQQNGSLLPATDALAPTGWWRSLLAVDWDQDGDLDIMAGNQGLNGPLQASVAKPVCIYNADYDGNGTDDPVVTAFKGELAYPIHPRNTLTRQIPSLKTRIPDFASYGRFTSNTLVALANEQPLTELCLSELRSAYLENDGKGHFTFTPLASQAQLAPVRGMATWAPGYIIAVGNDYAAEVLGGRYDAGNGLVMRRSTTSSSPSIDLKAISTQGDAHAIAILRSSNHAGLVVVGSQQGITVYRQKLPEQEQ